jgi:hypothetical protein
MAEIDPNIALGVRPVQFENPMDLATGAMKLRNLGLQGQNEQITLQQNQRTLQDQKTIADLYRANVNPATGEVNHAGIVQGLAQAGLGDKIPAYQQQVSAAAKGTTEASAADLSLTKQRLDMFNSGLSSLLSKRDLNHNDVIAQINNYVNQGIISPQQGAEAARNTPGQPDQLRSFLMQQAMTGMNASQQLDARIKAAPQVEKIDTGSNINLAQRDPLTGQITMGQNVRKGVSPDTQANITKDYAVAGLNPDGTPGQANQALVKMIGEGRMIPSDRLESTPRGQAVLAEVEKQYPGYDVTTARAKQKAAYDFGPGGKDATAMRSIGTATKHLDMLSTLVDNLDNTDSPAFNSVANFWKTQTGGTAPKTFDAAKQIVGQEVTKAIVAGGGGVVERQEAADALSKASSPAQLKSVIATYKTIMGAQHESLLQQRDAAGLSRSTLPDYTEGASGKPGVATPPVPIKSDNDYAALKSGTRFVAPDGSIRVKP